MTDKKHIRLGVNIDHVATVRNARGIFHPDPVRAALIAEKAGADGITAHLREDRRHIVDEDIYRLKKEVNLPLNLEMAATKEMLQIALNVKPNACCIVPEKRKELTTEGGLDVAGNLVYLKSFIERLKIAGIRVSLFIEPNEKQIRAAVGAKADIVELHTGAYCEAKGEKRKKELLKIIKAAEKTSEYGLECHAGHGLSYDTVIPIAEIAQIKELNIGHFLVGEAVFIGVEAAIEKMRRIMREARQERAA